VPVTGNNAETTTRPSTVESSELRRDGFVSDPTHNPKQVAHRHRYRAHGPQLAGAMDSAGNFIVVWEAFQDNDIAMPRPTATGIYSRRFTRTARPATAVDQQANSHHYPDRETRQLVPLRPPGERDTCGFAGESGESFGCHGRRRRLRHCLNGNGATPNPLNLTKPQPRATWIRRRVDPQLHAENPLNPGEFEAVTTQMRVNHHGRSPAVPSLP